ncbi:hypothetical protein [Proteus columbae]
MPPLEMVTSPSDLIELPSVINVPDDAIEIPLLPVIVAVAY